MHSSNTSEPDEDGTIRRERYEFLLGQLRSWKLKYIAYEPDAKP